MNWYQKIFGKKPEPIPVKSDYTIIWESMKNMDSTEQKKIINRLVKAFMPGFHVQGSYRGKK